MAYEWVRFRFGDDDGEGQVTGGDIPFNVNWDMRESCFVADGGIVILDEVPFTDQTFRIAVGAVNPIDFDTVTMLASWSVSTIDSFDHIISMQMLRQCYLGKYFSGWAISSDKPAMVTGEVLLYGKLVACDSTIMAQVTFDYSSLIEVGTADAVAASRAKPKVVLPER